MSPLEYLGGALDDWPLYLGLTTLSLLFHALLIWRWTVGVFDPLLMLLVSNALGWSIVWFMFLRGDIVTVYVASFSTSQLALYIGMGIVRFLDHPPHLGNKPVPDAKLPMLSLVFATAVHLLSTLTIWALAGIPLFRDSRLGAFVGSGGLGILERLTDSSIMIALFSATYLVLCWPRLMRHPGMFAFWFWIFVSLAMSGSKGALLSTIQVVLSIAFVFGSLRNLEDRFWGGRSGKWLVIAATLFALAVLAVQQDGDIALAGIGLLYRIVSYGDVYIFAYVDGTIEALKGSNPFVGMFGGFLSTFRLLPVNELDPHVGLQLADLVFPGIELVAGPNPQHPVFGYHYFGAFGFVFSFLLGSLTMALHGNFYFREHRTFALGLLAFMLYFNLVSFSIDFDYSMSRLASMVVGLVVILGPALLLCPEVPIWTVGRVPTKRRRWPTGAA